jgi:hypothetical protein
MIPKCGPPSTSDAPRRALMRCRSTHSHFVSVPTLRRLCERRGWLAGRCIKTAPEMAQGRLRGPAKPASHPINSARAGLVACPLNPVAQEKAPPKRGKGGRCMCRTTWPADWTHITRGRSRAVPLLAQRAAVTLVSMSGFRQVPFSTLPAWQQVMYFLELC